MPEQHAKLSASSAHRWLHCPPSVRLAEQFPSTSSAYAEAGRLAHSIAELKARRFFLEPAEPVSTYRSSLKRLQSDPYYDKDMEESTDLYLDYLKEIALSFSQAPFVALETRVNFSDYVPEGFGTADCIMIGDDRIYIIDYKNGAGVPVEAEKNPQMMLYALGALQVYAPIFGNSIRIVELAIVQPNAGGIKAWGTTVEALLRWAADVVKPTAKLAFNGEGNFSAGDWCRFCPAKSQCSARARQMLELEPAKGAVPIGTAAATLTGEKSDPPLLTDNEIGDILTRGRELAAWVKDLEDYALSASLAGRKIAGYKVVEGRGTRDWIDTDAAFTALQEWGIAEALLYERKPVSVAGLEKALGKKTFAQAAEGLVIKKPGKPTLVADSDKRPPYNAAEIAFGGGNA